MCCYEELISINSSEQANVIDNKLILSRFIEK